MKRIITLALAAGLFMGASVAAEAAEINVSGLYRINMNSYDNLGLKVGDNSDLNVNQRAEFRLDIVNSENLSAVFKVRVPNNSVWGDGAPFDMGGGDTDVTLKSAYIDWIIPTTDVAVRMGLQSIALPNIMGSSVLDDDMAGVAVSVPMSDMFAMNFIWARPVDGVSNAMGGDFYGINDATGGYIGLTPIGEEDGGDTLDIFAITAPITGEGFNVTPWAAYALAGNNVGSLADYNEIRTYLYNPATGLYNPTNTILYAGADLTKAKALVGENTWYAGFTAGLTMFDPFAINFAFTYGSSTDMANYQYLGVDAQNQLVDVTVIGADASGWLAEMELAYATNYGTAKVFGWYGSGDERDALEKGEFGRLPEVDGGQGHMMSAYFDETAIGGMAPSTGVTTKAGTWAAGLGWYGYEPMEDLSLRAHVMYISGTNNSGSGVDSNANYLYYGDNVLELTAAAKYNIYKDLMTVVEVNYLISDIESYDKQGIESNGYRASVGFQYNF